MFTLEKVGATRAILSPHVRSQEVQTEIQRFPKYAVVGLGQGGGRMASELARFGFPTYIVNSSKSDMEEHKRIIPDSNRILTSSKEFPELEGTDKNALLGFEIAKENKDLYKQLAQSDEIKDAEFVWVCVSLGGGTGNGALRVALSYLSQIRSKRKYLGEGKVPLGVICSLPAKSEYGSTFRNNALAGVALIQSMIDEKKIGSVLTIDNEKISNYYEDNPLVTMKKTEIDAKTYTNMMVSSLLVEVSSLPLLNGRSVLDKTEFLSTIATPGWLSISRSSGIQDDENLGRLVENLYTKNEVLAQNDMQNIIVGATAIIHPSNKNVSPEKADNVAKIANQLLGTRINVSITSNTSLQELMLYGFAVSSSVPSRVKELEEELDVWLLKEEEKEQERLKAAQSATSSRFKNFFNQSSEFSNRKSDDSTDFVDDFEDDFEKGNDYVKAASVDELEDDF